MMVFRSKLDPFPVSVVMVNELNSKRKRVRRMLTPTQLSVLQIEMLIIVRNECFNINSLLKPNMILPIQAFYFLFFLFIY